MTGIESSPAVRPFRRGLIAATFGILVVLLCLAGCGGKKQISSNAPQQPLFTPLGEEVVKKLTTEQARTLALKMDRRNQGMNSLRELDFAVTQSLAHASARPAADTAFSRPSGPNITYGKLAQSLRHLKNILPRLDADPGLLARDFDWYRIGPDFGFTGYYEPTLAASRVRSKEYYYPLYRKPPELAAGKGFHTRNAIDRKGALAGRNLEIAWVNSEADAFFLHIQGSGRLRFPDGKVSHVLYAGKNNRAYVSLGRVMREEGLLAPDNISMQSIRQVLREKPYLQPALFDKNPSYVFFRESDKGPYGAMGRPLTPWVSTATDKRVMPHGMLNFVILPLPDKSGTPTRPFYGLTLPQDVGGAIKGYRVDLFCGPGEFAEHTAGYLSAKGAVHILIKKD